MPPIAWRTPSDLPSTPFTPSTPFRAMGPGSLDNRTIEQGSYHVRTRRMRLAVASSIILLTLVVLGTLLLGQSSSLHAQPAAAAAQAAGAPKGSISLQAMHALFFVWASGTPQVQRLAAQDCVELKLTSSQCESVSAAVRAAWLD